MTDLEKFEFIYSHFENAPETCRILVLETCLDFPIYQKFIKSSNASKFQFHNRGEPRRITSRHKCIDFYTRFSSDHLCGLKYDSCFTPVFFASSEIGLHILASVKDFIYDFGSDNYVLDFAADNV